MKFSVVIPMILSGAMAAPMAQDAVEKMADVAITEGSNANAAADVQAAAPAPEMVQGPAVPAEGEVANPRQKTVLPYFNPLATLSGLGAHNPSPLPFQGSLSDLILAYLISGRGSASQPQQIPKPAPGSQTQPPPSTQPNPRPATGSDSSSGGLVGGLGKLLETVTGGLSSLLVKAGSGLDDALGALENGLGDLGDDITMPSKV